MMKICSFALVSGLLILLVSQGGRGGSPPAELPKEVTNAIGMKLVRIPRGIFRMGSPRTERHSGPNEDLISVEIPSPFLLGVTEVTQAQYKRLMGVNPSFCQAKTGGRFAGLRSDDHPVEHVTWEEAVEFCAKQTALPEEKQAGRVYRLPTDAEWEYACRAGTTTVFHYGDSLSSKQANFYGDLPYGGAPAGPNRAGSTKVLSFEPNAFGLYDMHGNAKEWSQEWLFVRKPDGSRVHLGPKKAEFGILRGGSFWSAGHQCRSAEKFDGVPEGTKNYDTGFRVHCLLAPQKD